jgi:hypothetical protein
LLDMSKQLREEMAQREFLLKENAKLRLKISDMEMEMAETEVKIVIFHTNT